MMRQRARKSKISGALRWALLPTLALALASCEAGVVEPCDAEQKESIEQSITAQAESLTAGDWESAYSYASPSFRSAVTIGQFEQIILGQYDMLLSFESAQFGRCEVLASRAAIMSVEVQSDAYQPVIMVYEMVASDGVWFVNGVAVPISAIPNA